MAQTYAGSCLSLDQRTSATVHHLFIALWRSIDRHNLLVLCWSLDVRCLCCTDRTELIIIQTVESGHRAMQFYLEGLDAQQASPPWCRPYNFPTQCMPRLVHLDQFNSIHWLERLHYSGIIVCMQSTQKELTFSSDVGCTKLSFPNWAAKQRYWDLDLKSLACTRIELSRRETFQRNHTFN